MMADSPLAGWLFAAIVGLSLILALIAARRTGSVAHFYNAGGRIGAIANGVAISAEFTSAASLLGVIALFYSFGGDSMPYFLSTCIGFAFTLFVMAERYRELGRFTVADVLASRFDGADLRIMAACSTLVIVLLYLISQLVGGAQLVALLFGIDYRLSLFVIAALIVAFVTVGGMLATTWIQVIKATLFVGGLVVLSFIIMASVEFDFARLLQRVAQAHPAGSNYMTPGPMLPDLGATLSLGAAMTFGVAGLPHILIRFCTVKDARAAKKSMVVATLVICLVVVCYLLVSLAAVDMVAGDHRFVGVDGKPLGGANMVFLHLISAMGGPVMLGIVCAAIYATIMAVVSGLIITAVSALAHDLIGRGRVGHGTGSSSLMLSRLCTLAVVTIAVLLAIAFERQNIGFTMSLAFAVAASANFPVLLLTLHWRGLTSRGAFWGGVVGLGSSVVLGIMGPTVWTDVLGQGVAPFPYREPTLVTIPLAFLTAWAMSRPWQTGTSLSTK